jgi:hypothetical protein
MVMTQHPLSYTILETDSSVDWIGPCPSIDVDTD